MDKQEREIAEAWKDVKLEFVTIDGEDYSVATNKHGVQVPVPVFRRLGKLCDI